MVTYHYGLLRSTTHGSQVLYLQSSLSQKDFLQVFVGLLFKKRIFSLNYVISSFYISEFAVINVEQAGLIFKVLELDLTRLLGIEWSFINMGIIYGVWIMFKNNIVTYKFKIVLLKITILCCEYILFKQLNQ